MSSDRIEIIRELRALEKFCAFPQNMGGEERERFLKDYLADIQEFPFSAVQRACAEWRKSGSTKFPTTGQLIPMIRRFLPVESSAERVEPWKPATQEEFDGMTLREKVREHRILAHEARRKAGPMWANGKPLAIEEMSDHWREWTRRAEHHEAEAGRLSKFLRPQPVGMAAE